MMKKVFRMVFMFSLLCGCMAWMTPQKAKAESTDIYQVNGKYSIDLGKLVTYCGLETADSGLKAKKRTFKITAKTKFQKVMRDYSKKTVKKSKVKGLIKKLNKSNETIQFQFKKGKVTLLYYNI